MIARQTRTRQNPNPATRAAGWLCLAATPSFALMALLTAGSSDPLCLADASPLGGMGWMYLLMSVFHAGPWLRLIDGAGRIAGPS